MGYRTVQKVQAKRMAKAAGLTARNIRELDFREVMAEHAVKLLISIVVKRGIRNDKTRQTAVAVGASAATAYSDTAGQA